MDKITIERETLERLVRWIGASRAIIETDLFNELRAALAAQPAANPWREALIDELVVTGIYQHMHEDHPRQAVQDVINWHTSVALDPAVSSEAQALIDRGKAAQPAEPVAWQGGMNNAELTDAWCKKLPGVIPTESQMAAFAIGIEVGFAHARDLERQDWSRVHDVLSKHGKHPGRTDDHLADVIDKALVAPPAPAAAPTEEQVMQAIRSLGAEGQGRITLTYETGPYDIDKPTLVAMRLARAMIAAAAGDAP